MRVYGLLIDQLRVLLSDEWISAGAVTKFPGGGLEFGEGTIACLQREFKEELGLDVRVKEHFYTTDFYVVSAFDPQCQVISIYYLVEPVSEMDFKASSLPHDYEPVKGAQSFRWMAIDRLSPDDLSLVIDRKVAELIRIRFSANERT